MHVCAILGYCDPHTWVHRWTVVRPPTHAILSWLFSARGWEGERVITMLGLEGSLVYQWPAHLSPARPALSTSGCSLPKLTDQGGKRRGYTCDFQGAGS